MRARWYGPNQVQGLAQGLAQGLRQSALETALMQTRRLRLSATNKSGIMTRPAWTLMHRLPMYAACPRMDLAVAESLERRIINIPSSAFLHAAGRVKCGAPGLEGLC